MTFITAATPFSLSADQWSLINQQKAITAALNRAFVQVAANWLKPASKDSYETDWQKKPPGLETNLQSWIDDDEIKYNNVGFSLQLGFLDIDIDAADGCDPEYNRCIVAGLRQAGVDTRLCFGRQSVGAPTHVLVQLAEEDHTNFDKIRKWSPAAFVIGGKRYFNALRSFSPLLKGADLAAGAVHVTMPGSVYRHKQRANEADISVWWKLDGSIAARLDEILTLTPKRTPFSAVLKGIAFGTALYAMRPHWVEGNRQQAATRFGGWLARIVGDSDAINSQDKLKAAVFCPVENDDAARTLINLICDQCHDDEAGMRIRTYKDARGKLARNPEAKIPGWPAMRALIGPEVANALKATFMPGSDVSPLMRLSERYIYVEVNNRFVDLEIFRSGLDKYIFAAEELRQRHLKETIPIGDKNAEAFRIYERSSFRKDVTAVDMDPGLEAGRIALRNCRGDILNESEDIPEDAHSFFNQWRGWDVEPIKKIDDKLMAECIRRLDQVLGWLTCDNRAQMEWIKDWFAWTLQYPRLKQQIAWVVIGGMGVGKSFIGDTFAKAIYGSMHGTASPQIIDQKFNVSSFLGKMFVFIDEARFNGEAGSDEVKKLIRNVRFHGMEKGVDARDYHIYARLMFAANKFNLSFGNGDTHDRGLFYTKAYTHDFLGINEKAFKVWAETIRPDFESFAAFLEKPAVREHYIRMLMDRKLDRSAVESTRLSSSDDVDIIVANMTWRRKVARAIVQSGWIISEDSDISSPFSSKDLHERVNLMAKQLNIPGVRPEDVFHEFSAAGVIESFIGAAVKGFRFKWKIGALHDKMAEATGAPLDAQYVFTDADYQLNDADAPVSARLKLGRTKTFGVIDGGRGKF